jgi:AcrR family transcriptional regulator
MDDKSYHHGNLRAALIEAGLSALERQSTAELSLRALAREVGVSANAAYRHFTDKDDLLAALATEGFKRFAAHQTQAATSQTDPLLARKAAAQAYIAFARDNPALFRLMFGQFLSARQHAELKSAAEFAFHGLLHGTAQELGEPPESEHARLVAVARWGLVHGLSHLLLDGQLNLFGQDARAIIDGVLALPPADLGLRRR